jgi:hypothetical protein
MRHQLRFRVGFHEADNLVYGVLPVRGIAGHNGNADGKRLQHILCVNFSNGHVEFVACFFYEASADLAFVFKRHRLRDVKGYLCR